VDGTIGDIVADFSDNVAVFGDIVAGVDGALQVKCLTRGVVLDDCR